MASPGIWRESSNCKKATEIYFLLINLSTTQIITQINNVALFIETRLNSTMESKKREKQRRYAQKLKQQGRRVYSARMKCEIADAVVSIAKAQRKTASALTEEILSEFVHNNQRRRAMDFFKEKPTRETILPAVHNLTEAQEAAAALLRFAPTAPPQCADLLAPLLRCWPAATSAALTVGDMIRLFGGSVASEAERSKLLAATPAGPDRDALEAAKIEGMDWGMLQIALIQAVTI